MESLTRPFYTAKPVRSRLGTPGDFIVLSQSFLCKIEGGVKSPVRHGAGFPGSLEKAGLLTESRPLSNNLHTPECFHFFMNEDTRMQK